jgi:hypothetical protein
MEQEEEEEEEEERRSRNLLERFTQIVVHSKKAICVDDFWSEPNSRFHFQPFLALHLLLL